ncbi:ATP-dependent Clp protease proteolytic subunit [Chamaesiphon sp. VAR_69_metabat_338]|uniref:ATP-dependent Clp protease proteolytic subunit n=1 Tax=Chamaesiphon sp. VAR_69_metabat_338 TaxID=2964704 RepID=UPI00286D7BFC|nr:ATP-dependent Clp protease proteolytic subunit [Chamaesiphon sp. VAR_69_metabat_338]
MDSFVSQLPNMYSFDRDRQLQSRTIFLRQTIDDRVANEAIAQSIYLDLADPDTPIQLYINTSSGSIAAGLAIYDTIQSLKVEVQTICMGVADGVGSLLLASGSPGNRSAQPHARIRLAQADEMTLTSGTAREIESAARAVFRQRQILYELYAQATGRASETIAEDTAKREFMSATEAQAYGLIDFLHG